MSSMSEEDGSCFCLNGLHIDLASYSMNDFEGRLAAIEIARHLSVLLLALVSSSGGFPFTGGGAAASSDFLAISCWVVGEAG